MAQKIFDLAAAAAKFFFILLVGTGVLALCLDGQGWVYVLSIIATILWSLLVLSLAVLIATGKAALPKS